MKTVTISKKEYDALVFAKGLKANKIPPKNKTFKHAGFGVLKNSFGKKSSVAVVRALRKSWR